MTVAELEQFFWLAPRARMVVADKRRPATNLGWAVEWGTVRMLGTVLADAPLKVPDEVVAFAAEQVGMDAACAPEYPNRPKTAYEHAWEIRDLLGLAENCWSDPFDDLTPPGRSEPRSGQVAPQEPSHSHHTIRPPTGNQNTPPWTLPATTTLAAVDI
nr:hypothetical protein GCM10010200_100340 [Actinomadura rugatobispora]